MIWVGGGIVIHGLAEFGLDQIDHLVEAIAHWAEELAPQMAGFLAELATILADLVFGLLLGLILIPVMNKLLVPAWKSLRNLFPRRKVTS